MNRKIILLLSIFFILGIIFFLTYEEETPEAKMARIEEQRKDAYKFAVSCSGLTPKLKYEDITWVVMPGSKLTYKAIDGKVELGGYFSPNDSIIYVPETNEDRFWILAHESMHAIGVFGHPDEPFRRCRLMSDQN